MIIVISLLSACSSPIRNKENAFIYSYADLKEHSTTVVYRSELLTSPLEYVELEMTDNSLVGYIERIVVNDSLIYIKSDGSIHLFDRNGNFRNSIGRVGQGGDRNLIFSKKVPKNGTRFRNSSVLEAIEQ